MITMHGCNSCPFFVKHGREESADGTCGWDPEPRDIRYVTKRKGCSKHPKVMQQYEKLRGAAQAAGAMQETKYAAAARREGQEI